MTNHVWYKIEEIVYVLNLVVQVFFSDIISEEPMLQFEYLHIHEPITCMGEYKDEWMSSKLQMFCLQNMMSKYMWYIKMKPLHALWLEFSSHKKHW